MGATGLLSNGGRTKVGPLIPELTQRPMHAGGGIPDIILYAGQGVFSQNTHAIIAQAQADIIDTCGKENGLAVL